MVNLVCSNNLIDTHRENLQDLGVSPSQDTLALVRNSLKDESLIERACSIFKDLGESLIAGP